MSSSSEGQKEESYVSIIMRNGGITKETLQDFSLLSFLSETDGRYCSVDHIACLDQIGFTENIIPSIGICIEGLDPNCVYSIITPWMI